MVDLVAPMDAVWLWVESARSPKHVVVLQVFTPPADAGPSYLDDLYTQITDASRVKPGFRRRAVRSLSTGGQFAWSTVEAMDLTEHVQRHTLPAPGGERELLDYVAELHGRVLPRSRPQWAARLVDGLVDGQFALCTLLHHSLFDGVNMGRHVIGGLSPRADATDCTAPWIRANRAGAPSGEPEHSAPTSLSRTIADTARDVGNSLRAIARSGARTFRERELPFAAPPTILNQKITQRRAFSAGTWPLARFKDVAKGTGTSVNDVGLAVVGAALRHYLIEQDALPHRSLVAGVPVAITGTAADATSRDDNSFAAVLVNLDTDLDDPLERLRRTNASMVNSKALMKDMDPLTGAAFTTANIGGFLLGAVDQMPNLPRPAFNAVVSNVPGPRGALYWNGARMVGFYPSSVVMHGQALNITLLSYDDTITVGLTSCPDAVPNVGRVLVNMEKALADLEKARDRSGAAN